MEPSASRDQASWATAPPALTDLPSNVRTPGDDEGYSLADIARRDLDAALQLLVDRAQYITGASGAAIALRRRGKKDMQCRASAGSNAPELGALLSTEFGLSGESVRTRQPLRCDDAERDVRVNRDVCRHLGIASVIVMPVVNDEEVLGVFELFSGEVNAFGERDLSAVQRLSEMVETAVRLAEATEKLPEWLRTSGISAPAADAGVEEDKILEGPDLETPAPQKPVPENLAVEDLVLEDAVLEESKPVLKVAAESAERTEVDSSVLEALTAFGEDATPESLPSKTISASPISGQAPSQEDEQAVVRGMPATLPESPKAAIAENVAAAPEAPKVVNPADVAPVPQASLPGTESVPAAESTPSKNQLFWSAALNPAADAGKPAVDQSHVPPVLRNLHKCQACGFPVSTGRVLCVECEEKKWRGQLKVPQGRAPKQGALPGPAATVEASPKPEVRVFAAAAQSMATGIPVSQRGSATVVQPSTAVQRKEFGPAEQPVVPPAPVAGSPGQELASHLVAPPSEAQSPEFVLSAGLQPSQSWFSANKYVLIVVLVVGLATVAFFVLR